MGWDILNKRESTRPFAEAALYHHKWYDEKGGYPADISYRGVENAILYQIITCADCFDAATDAWKPAYKQQGHRAFLLQSQDHVSRSST